MVVCLTHKMMTPGNAGTGFLVSGGSSSTMNDSVYYYQCRTWLCADQGFGNTGQTYTIYNGNWSFSNDLRRWYPSWEPDVTYNPDDTVRVGRKPWVALQQSINIKPEETAGWESYWTYSPHHVDFWFGAGHGYKYGLVPYPIDSIQTKMINNIAVYNRNIGFHENSNNSRPNTRIYNNLAAYNGHQGFYAGYAYESNMETAQNIYRNNISYHNNQIGGNGVDMGIHGSAAAIHSHNTWDEPFHTPTSSTSMDSPAHVNDSQFRTVPDSLTNFAIMSAPRQPSGELPDLGDYWKLAPTSDFIDAGIDVGLDYNGTAPDLGPFQYNPDETGYILIFQIENETGNAINNASITFNGATRPPGVYTLQGIEEGTCDFSVAAPGYETYTQTGLLVEGDTEIKVIMTLNNYQIDLITSPVAGGSASGQGSYQHGQTVNVSAQANTGYNFVNWTENGNVVSTNPNYSFTATQNRNLVANFSVQTYTVSLSANPTGAGTLSGAGNYNHNANVTISAQANTGYTFVNWTENGNLVSTNPQFSFNISENREFIANFSINSYTISAAPNPAEAGTVSGTGTFNHGQIASLQATPADEYNFLSWTENGNVVSQNQVYSFTVTQNRNLTANFAMEVFSINLESNPTGAGILQGEGNYNPGDNVTINAQSHAGYSFVNWTENGNIVSSNPQFSFTIAENREFIAHFNINTYEVTATSDPVEGGSVSGTGVFNHGQTANLQATAAEGYNFVNWTENGNTVSQNPFYTFTVSQNRSLTANFSSEIHTLTLNPNPTFGGITTGAGSYPHGQNVTAGALPNPGFHFVSWTQNGLVISNDAFYSFLIMQDRDLTAWFAPNEYLVQVQISPEEGGMVTGAGWYEHGDAVTLVASPAQDYVFLHWLDADLEVSESPELTFIATKDRDLLAVFIHVNELVRIDAQSFPPGYAFIEGAGDYPINQKVTLNAEPVTSDYSFVGWMENGRYIGHENPILFNALEDRNIEARFIYEPSELEVMAHLSIPETGFIYGAGNYSRGQVAILQAELNENVSFLGWKNQAGQIVSRQNPYNFEVNRNMDMIAMVELKYGTFVDDFKLRVYPNPSDGRFTVNIREEALMTVHNSHGVALESQKVTPENNQLNLGYLPSGVYTLRFQTQNEILSAKIIIK
jgi:hypothetical protein